MKSRIFGTFMLLTMLSVTTFGQSIENDDMYFNARDRQKLRELKTNQYAMANARETKQKNVKKEEQLNPSDSYSARTVNPEYSARSNAETATADNEDYFLPNYQYQTATNLRSFNNNFNSWYGSNWYSGNYWGPAINRWNSPFYGSYYNSWGSPWNNPYYTATYSSGFSYYWGNTWDYGWGYNNYWNCPSRNYGWGSAWGPSFAFGYSSWYGPSWYSGYYPRVVVVNNYSPEGGRKVVYGKRPSRGSEFVSSNSNTRTRSSYTPDAGPGRGNTGGRTSSDQGYYNKSWRYTAPSNAGDGANSNSSYSNTTTRTRTSSYSDGNQRSSSGNSNSSYSSPSRSSSSSYGSSNSSSSGGSRSSTPAPSSGSNGRTRGGR